jgi:hypothetical protein
MSKRNQRKEYRPSGWQLDPESITTERVQYWSNGVMSWFVTREQARRMVTNGNAFVVSDQAIGAMIDGVANS